MTERPFASYWLAAAESGYAHHGDWTSWADRRILKCDDTPSWVINLSLAKTSEEFWRILSPIIDWEVQHGFDRRLIAEAVLGYLWLRYLRGDFDLRTCLERAGRHADAYDTEMECEAFFALVNRLDAAGSHVTFDMGLLSEAERLFDSSKPIAVQQLAELQADPSGTCVTS